MDIEGMGATLLKGPGENTASVYSMWILQKSNSNKNNKN